MAPTQVAMEASLPRQAWEAAAEEAKARET